MSVVTFEKYILTRYRPIDTGIKIKKPSNVTMFFSPRFYVHQEKVCKGLAFSDFQFSEIVFDEMVDPHINSKSCDICKKYPCISCSIKLRNLIDTFLEGKGQSYIDNTFLNIFKNVSSKYKLKITIQGICLNNATFVYIISNGKIVNFKGDYELIKIENMEK